MEEMKKKVVKKITEILDKDEITESDIHLLSVLSQLIFVGE